MSLIPTPLAPTPNPQAAPQDFADWLAGMLAAILNELACLDAIAASTADTQIQLPIYTPGTTQSATPIALADPGRVELIVTNLGPGIVWWGRSSAVLPQLASGQATSLGGQPGVAGQTWVFDYRTAKRAYFGWTDPAATAASVVSVSRASAGPTA